MAAAGAHAVTVTPVGGSAVDVSCWVLSVDIADGRDDPGSQPDAATATLQVIARPSLGALPAALEIGSALVVTTTAGAAHSRFVGTISDLALGWEDAGAATPDAGVGQVIAAGVLAGLGFRSVGDAAWPAELDGARVSRVMAAAGVTLSPATSDPGTVQIIARDPETVPALEAAQSVAQSATGVVWSTRAGEVRYADSEHRRNTPVALSLDACDIEVTPTWRRSTEGLVNEVSIGYGTAPAGGEQPRYVATAPASVGVYGRRGYSIVTELAALGDAQAVGGLLLARNSSPVWVMADLPVNVAALTTAQYTALLGLEVHSLVQLTGLPALGGAPTQANLWVEGRAEHLEYGLHEITLVVSGYCRTAPAPRWDDVDPSYTWDTMQPAGITWDQITCLGPPVRTDRWNDQPATLRWDQVPAATTWDTYTGA